MAAVWRHRGCVCIAVGSWGALGSSCVRLHDVCSGEAPMNMVAVNGRRLCWKWPVSMSMRV